MAEVFDIIFGLIATEYYVMAVVVAVALFFFLRWNAAETKIWVAQKDEKMRPIAAAFDIVERRDILTLTGCMGTGENGVHWGMTYNTDWQLDYIAIDADGNSYDTHVRYDETQQKYKVWSVGVATGELMARGLYRLGFDEVVLAQLPPLSAHEKLELRLSLPREFWPQKWCDEVSSGEAL